MTTDRDEGGPAAGALGWRGEAAAPVPPRLHSAVSWGLLRHAEASAILRDEARCVLSLGIFDKLTR